MPACFAFKTYCFLHNIMSIWGATSPKIKQINREANKYMSNWRLYSHLHLLIYTFVYLFIPTFTSACPFLISLFTYPVFHLYLFFFNFPFPCITFSFISSY